MRIQNDKIRQRLLAIFEYPDFEAMVVIGGEAGSKLYADEIVVDGMVVDENDKYGMLGRGQGCAMFCSAVYIFSLGMQLSRS